MSNGRLANLVIAGVPKAGTGSLFAYLAQHPDICASDVKEIGYFNRFHARWYPEPPPPIEVYEQHFAHCSGERYALEATPNYSYIGRPVISAIRKVLGEPRIILILRDPVDRLWSGYTFQRAGGKNVEIGSFAQYLETVERLRRDGTDLVPGDGLHGLHIGFYADYVGDWLDEFGSDLRIVFTDDLHRDPRAVVEELCTWLGIETDVVASLDLGARNVTRHPRNARLAHLARTLKQRGEQLHLLPPSAYRKLRGAYFRLNAGTSSERLDPVLRRHVEDIYRESNRITAKTLAAHGYRQLPPWLGAGSPT
jgi:hypothetical protein